MKILPPIIACALLLITSARPSDGADVLVPGEPLILAGTHGKFDFLAIDGEGRRLLAAHTGNSSLDVIDLDKKELIKVIATGAAQSSAVDAESKSYYVAVSKPPQLAIIDSSTLSVVAKVPLEGPADILAFNSKAGRAYIGHDDGKELWIVDASSKKVIGSIALPSDSPEDLAFDSSLGRLFQCMKTGSVIAVIDTSANKVIETWPTAPAQAPHGMAMANEEDAFIVAGGNGKIVLMSQKDGHVLSSAEIPQRVDQIAYDHEIHRVYCASGTGRIAVVGVDKQKLTSIGEIAASEGCHSIAVDSKTHTVWIAYAKGESSFVQPFVPSK